MAKHKHIRIEESVVLDALMDRARRLRRKGELRRALAVLREACLREEHDAARWALYGALSLDAGRHDDGVKALRHAIWLRHRAGDSVRVGTTQALLSRGGSIAA